MYRRKRWWAPGMGVFVLLVASPFIPVETGLALPLWMQESAPPPERAGALSADPGEPNGHLQLGAQRDYIYPSVEAVAAPAPKAADGDTVSYTAFDKTVYSLRQFNGRYTALLIKPEDLATFTVERVRITIDRNDVLYTQYREFLGWEPPGEGLLPVAYVKTCGAGCGFVSAKGIELDPRVLADWVDYSYAYVVHEMAHNFDLYSDFIFIKPDIAHSWTDFLSRYIVVYNRYGGTKPDSPLFSPEEQIQYWVDQNFLPYVRYPGATWEKCIRDDLCNPSEQSKMAQHTQGGVVLRLAQLYGVAPIKNWVRYLAAQVAARKLSSQNMAALQKNDLLIETLSVGVAANLTCFFDWLKWPVSDDLRVQLGAQFGTNARCRDADGDGYTPIQGDCNDANPAVNPGAKEALNGVDDDCNGIVDDLLSVEAGDFPNSWQSPLALRLPARVQGAISSNSDVDAFSIELASGSPLKFTLKSTSDFKGWLFLHKQGSAEWLSNVYVRAGASSILTASLGAGRWVFEVAYNNASNPGAYEVAVQAVQPWPIPFSVAAPTSDRPGRYILRAPDLPQAIATIANPTARFWVSGSGWVGSTAVQKGSPTILAWLAPETLVGTSPLYRVQFYDGNLPAIAVSEPVSFPVTAAGFTIGALVHGASFLSGAIAPGEIVSIFGSGLGPGAGAGARLNSARLVDNLLSGTRVLFDGLPAPLFFARADQVNAVVPYAVQGKVTTQVQVEYNETLSKALTVPVTAAAPGLFTADGGTGQGAILNEDGSANSAANPASKGSIVVLYATGEGQTNPPGVDGKLAQAPFPVPRLPVSVRIGGLEAQILYKGAAPGFAGLFQVNARVPPDAPAGNAVPVSLTVGSATSQPGVTLALR